jgi:hypothetical protein
MGPATRARIRMAVASFGFFICCIARPQRSMMTRFERDAMDSKVVRCRDQDSEILRGYRCRILEGFYEGAADDVEQFEPMEVVLREANVFFSHGILRVLDEGYKVVYFNPESLFFPHSSSALGFGSNFRAGHGNMWRQKARNRANIQRQRH